MSRVKPSPCNDVAAVDVEGELVAYDFRRGKLHFLNHSAAVVFRLCDGASTIKQISQAIAEAYDEQVETLEPIVRLSVKQLREQALLDAGPLTPEEELDLLPLDEGRRIRRQVPHGP